MDLTGLYDSLLAIHFGDWLLLGMALCLIALAGYAGRRG